MKIKILARLCCNLLDLIELLAIDNPIIRLTQCPPYLLQEAVNFRLEPWSSRYGDGL